MFLFAESDIHCLCTLFIVMDGSLPTSLKHIISNAEYYGPSLFLLGKHMENNTYGAADILAEIFMRNIL